MSRADQVFAELVSANPVPRGVAPHPVAWAEAALLDEIETRSRGMQTQQLKKAPEEPTRKSGRIGLRVAAAAFAAVLIVLGVVAALTAMIAGRE